MSTKILLGSIKLKNPILVASGTFGHAQEFSEYISIKKLGGVITKTITLKPRIGNPPPRIIETPSGMLNSIGLQNEGVDDFLSKKMPFLRKAGAAVIVSIGGSTVQEYIKLAKIFDKTRGVDAIELNISCPNVEDPERLISQDKKRTAELVGLVKKNIKKPIITKLSPNVTDIVEISQAAQDAGSNALSLVNTFLGMSIDVNKRIPKLGNVTGGLSGPAIKPIALRMVWQVANSVAIPIIGMGGIMNSDDAIEFMIAGASAVCVGTANFINPSSSIKIINGIELYLKRNKLNSIASLKRSLKTQ